MEEVGIYEGADENTTKIPVKSAILEDIQKRIQVQGNTCGCDDYDNCDYENRD